MDKNSSQISLCLNDGRKIVAELYNHDGSSPELSVYTVGADGMVEQDICLVRPSLNETTGLFDNRAYDCIVWVDSDNEDFTDKFQINRYTGGCTDD